MQTSDWLDSSSGAPRSRLPRGDEEALLRPVDHAALGGHLGLADSGRRLDIDDHCVLEIDQVVGGIGEEGALAACRCLACARIGHPRLERNRDRSRTKHRHLRPLTARSASAESLRAAFRIAHPSRSWLESGGKSTDGFSTLVF